MALAITPLHPHIGAEIGGLDVSRPINEAAVDELWRAIDRHSVVVFHDQQLTDEQLRAFAARFGELLISGVAARPGRRRLQLPEIFDVSNLDEDNRIRARDDRRRLDSLVTRLWHNDASHVPVQVVLATLFAVAVPPASPLGGGETEFADMRAAYDAAVTPSPGPPPSRLRAQMPLPHGTSLAHRRLAGAGRPAAVARPHRFRDAAAIRL
jgi:alpha-ketoglutarate-dependent 2,4-dichlorophenoxyacetate dioxygenase